MNLKKEKELQRARLEAEKEWHADEIVRCNAEIADIRDFLEDTAHGEYCTCMECEQK
jgi:hypothetical protein